MEEQLKETAHGPIRSFVLRAGRMSDAQRRSYEKLSPLYCIPYEKRLLDLNTLFKNPNPVVIEIGFGMGSATAQLAEQNPHINYLGIEVHRPGVGKLLWEIEQRGLTNIRIVEHDAVEVLQDMLAPESVDAFHVFFPDPWPKKRHHKRRLIKRPFTDLLVSRMKPGAYFYMATDWVDYGRWALAELSATPGLENPYDGFAPQQKWRPLTKFEKKGLDKAHKVSEIYMVRSQT
ncbi:tRNA (guanosine(46)-N7)-methyltransferase TrmB [Gracilinema caldarium]|uniref:tRNA (guanine-N(7)-)-methyltransferase n=1 Tax=Gracilinema caldarium (strain ATCC 51460 / DSM 7334 / H1) TaxID=744872 RepID=F8EXP4_GRAC1|nr:tRNA (guanosine(46)-N7)-methyltransferase TrmB [Gracilinema caldarium]AEJ19625.1 tRNA (guanine-N(7)-)-methyltransferase [Gracilinema caldarium DSM 7334]